MYLMANVTVHTQEETYSHACIQIQTYVGSQPQLVSSSKNYVRATHEISSQDLLKGVGNKITIKSGSKPKVTEFILWFDQSHMTNFTQIQNNLLRNKQTYCFACLFICLFIHPSIYSFIVKFSDLVSNIIRNK